MRKVIEELHEKHSILKIKENVHPFPVATAAADRWRIMCKDVYAMANEGRKGAEKLTTLIQMGKSALKVRKHKDIDDMFPVIEDDQKSGDLMSCADGNGVAATDLES